MQSNDNVDDTHYANYQNIGTLPGINELLRHWRNIGFSRRTGAALSADTSIEAQNCFLECFINRIQVHCQGNFVYNTEYLKCWLNDSLMTVGNVSPPVQSIPNNNDMKKLENQNTTDDETRQTNNKPIATTYDTTEETSSVLVAKTAQKKTQYP
jgi:hypothetical protein